MQRARDEQIAVRRDRRGPRRRRWWSTSPEIDGRARRADVGGQRGRVDGRRVRRRLRHRRGRRLRRRIERDVARREQMDGAPRLPLPAGRRRGAPRDVQLRRVVTTECVGAPRRRTAATTPAPHHGQLEHRQARHHRPPRPVAPHRASQMQPRCPPELRQIRNQRPRPSRSRAPARRRFHQGVTRAGQRKSRRCRRPPAPRAVGRLLALDAQLDVRHQLQPLLGDRLLALGAAGRTSRGRTPAARAPPRRARARPIDCGSGWTRWPATSRSAAARPRRCRPPSRPAGPARARCRPRRGSPPSGRASAAGDVRGLPSRCSDH